MFVHCVYLPTIRFSLFDMNFVVAVWILEGACPGCQC